MKWDLLHTKIQVDTKKIILELLKNRNIKTKKAVDDFLNPIDPIEIPIGELGIENKTVSKILKRLRVAKDKKEKIVIFGDYDADGVCSTAILWETLYKLGYDAMPYIPNRFGEGYGIKKESFDLPKIIELNPKLIITVDNGIVAYDALKEAKKRGIDIIIVDHHTKGTKKIETDFVFHSTLVCGSALSWFLSKELGVKEGLDLAALGTIADQMQLLNVNRSIVKYGLRALSKTKRVGLQALFKDSKVDEVGVYDVGFIIAPRINAMGRLANATDSLRFLCTRDPKKAGDLNNLLNETNIERQKIVEDVVTRTLKEVKSEDKVIVISGQYHEGVIGLASGKVTEKYYKPSIVFSVGEKVSRASARSINGFDIIEAIKETGLILEGGGHPMAAGFSIETTKISEFSLKINEIGNKVLTDDLLERKLKVDMEIDFKSIDTELVNEIKKFEPTGYGNYSPVFMTKDVEIVETKFVGTEGKHLKLKLSKDNNKIEAIAFGFGTSHKLKAGEKVDIAYTIEENIWNNKTSIQLKIKDIKI